MRILDNVQYDLEGCELKTVFRNGELTKFTTLAENVSTLIFKLLSSVGKLTELFICLEYYNMIELRILEYLWSWKE